jgi:hypothetical protein
MGGAFDTTIMNADIWKDPRIVAALKERSPDDIAVLPCPRCGRLGYYNQGSHFTCLKCNRTWYCCSEDEGPPLDGRPWMSVEDARTLEDVTE